MDSGGPHSVGKWARVSSWLSPATAVAVLTLPVLIDVLQGGIRRLFGYAAADTFYYLVVARNAGLEGVVGFDGEHPSNGFHPLWQAVTSLIYLFRLPGHGTWGDLVWLLILELLCLSSAIVLASKAFRREDGSSSPLLPLVVPGAFGLLVAPLWFRLPQELLAKQNGEEGAIPLYGSLWSFVNGMESSVSVFFFGAVFWYWVTRPLETRRQSVTLGLLLAGLMLARLDLVFIAFPVWCLTVIHLPNSRLRSSFAAATAAPVALYLAINRIAFGSLMPISGSLKSTAPYVQADNFLRLWNEYNQLVSGGEPQSPTLFRLAQLVIPALAALVAPAVLFAVKRTPSGILFEWSSSKRRAQFLFAASVGVLGLVGYNAFFVPLFSQGHWYVPVPEFFVSLLALHALERLGALMKRRPLLWGTAFAASVAMAMGFFVRFHWRTDYHARYADFALDEAPKIRAMFPEGLKMIEYDDGIVSWATGFRAMSGTGLGLDNEGAQAWKAGTLPLLAAQRGFTQMTSLVYFGAGGLTLTSGDEEMAGWLKTNSRFGLSGFGGRVRYRAEKLDFVIVELIPPPNSGLSRLGSVP